MVGKGTEGKELLLDGGTTLPCPSQSGCEGQADIGIPDAPLCDGGGDWIQGACGGLRGNWEGMLRLPRESSLTLSSHLLVLSLIPLSNDEWLPYLS